MLNLYTNSNVNPKSVVLESECCIRAAPLPHKAAKSGRTWFHIWIWLWKHEWLVSWMQMYTVAYSMTVTGTILSTKITSKVFTKWAAIKPTEHEGYHEGPRWPRVPLTVRNVEGVQHLTCFFVLGFVRSLYPVSSLKVFLSPSPKTYILFFDH